MQLFLFFLCQSIKLSIFQWRWTWCSRNDKHVLEAFYLTRETVKHTYLQANFVPRAILA